MAAVPAVALVTGGTRGIGLGIARALARDGWHLALAACGPRPRSRASSTSSRRSAAARTTAPADVAVPADRARLVEAAIATFGGIDALVNNAGRAPRVRADLLEAGEESFEELIRTNLQGPYFLTQQVARHMLARGHGTRPRSSSSPRSRPRWPRSTAATTASARRAWRWRRGSSRCAWRRRRSRSSRCGPGIIATDMTARVKDVYDQRIADGLVPEGRWGTPEDVGRVVAALLRGDAPYATGSVVHVDGGLSLGRL